jgi:NAD(P)-dependent dehydrogenase (short-subunit alcohol dehydrogenase family)
VGPDQYSQSKLANLMFTYELQRRLSGAGTTIAVRSNPGQGHPPQGRRYLGRLCNGQLDGA